jgi:hypothetical protein
MHFYPNSTWHENPMENYDLSALSATQREDPKILESISTMKANCLKNSDGPWESLKYKRLNAKIMRKFIELLASTWNSIDCSQVVVDAMEETIFKFPTFCVWKQYNPQLVKDGMSRAFVHLYTSIM